MKKIIIIDDDRKSIENLDILLRIKFYNFEVLLFEYPQLFIDAKINKIALIIVDIMFAGDGECKGGFSLGLEFYTDYKKENPNIPVIIYTNKTKESIDNETIKLIEHYCDLFIEKPLVSMDSIIGLIRNKLSRDKN